jgi:hypothetical protein
MDEFLASYQTVKGEPQDIDGIIAIDTDVLTELIRVLGPVEVPGYGTFSIEPDKKYGKPDIVIAMSEIIDRPTPYVRENRKGILGPMMQAILAKTYGAPKQVFPDLFGVIVSSLEGRHIQMYFLDDDIQTAAELIRTAGEMVAPTDGTDFLAIVDANLGGAKSNLFISTEFNKTVNPPQDGSLTQTLQITYKNTHPGDNCNLEAGQLCLNAVNHTWQRIYLPLGAKLIETTGYTKEPQLYEENGFTVIDGFFNLNPDSATKINLSYSIPYQDQQTYRLHIWKQGGVDQIESIIDVNGSEEELIITKDTDYQVEF